MALIEVPVTKSKGTVSFDTEKLGQEVYEEALRLGLKELANRGMSKITKTTYEKPEELQAAAQKKAEENVTAIYEGKIRFSGKKVAKASGAVMTEARRLAKNIVKSEIKKAGGKISHYEPKEITAAANEILKSEVGKDIIAQAEENLKARSEVPAGKIDISALIKPSANKVAKAEEKKAKDKADKPLSAKQAGQTAKRKPAAQPQA